MTNAERLIADFKSFINRPYASMDEWESRVKLVKCICGKENCDNYNCEHERIQK